MKLNLTKKASKVALFAAVLLASSLMAGRANAQAPFQGKFTLQHDTRWGKAVLAAGDYGIRFVTGDGFEHGVWVVTEAKSGKTVAEETCWAVDDAPRNGINALLIERRGNQNIIYSFRVAELGATCVYDRALASQRAAEDAKNTETVRVLVVKN
jgi:hypothetical protein